MYKLSDFALRIASLFLALLVVLSFVLLTLRKINPLLFWLMMGVSAGIAFWLLPLLKQRE